MSRIFRVQEGERIIALHETRMADNSVPMICGTLTTVITRNNEQRIVALVWDEERTLVEVGGVDKLTGEEVALLQEAGFTVPDSFIPRAVL